MGHILAKMKGVKLQDIKRALESDALNHAKQGLFLEHLWQNDDDKNEILFLFRTKDLKYAKKFIEKVHIDALKENPRANLPNMTFLEEK